MSYKSGGVVTLAQFSLNSGIPLDSRFVIATTAEYEALVSETGKYEGLEFAVPSELTLTNGNKIAAGIYRVGVDKETITQVADENGLALKLADAHKISLSGDASGNVTFDGGSDVTLNVTVADDSHTHDGRYYTESEMDIKLSGKADTNHGTHVSYSTTAPVMDGTASVGTASTVARSDHKHPTDSSRAPTSHASSATTYGVGTTANYGHVKISNGDVNSIDSADGLAAGMDHTHSNYANQNAFSKILVDETEIAADSVTDTITLVAGSNVTLTPDATNDKITIAATDNDTKNTAGSTDSNSKLYLIGATSQTASSQTYSHDTAYVGTDGHLYSNSSKTITQAEKGVSDGGWVPLNANGKIDTSYLPGYVDDVVSVANTDVLKNLEFTDDAAKAAAASSIYVVEADNTVYRYIKDTTATGLARFAKITSAEIGKEVMTSSDTSKEETTVTSSANKVYLNHIHDGNTVTSSHAIKGANFTKVSYDSINKELVIDTDIDASDLKHTHPITSTFANNGSSFSGTEATIKTSGTPKGTITISNSASTSTGASEYQPAGSVSSSLSDAKTESKTVNLAGTSKSVSVSGTPAGSVALSIVTTKGTGDLEYTPEGTVSKPTFTGTEGDVSVSGTVNAHTHNHSFTGTEATINVGSALTSVSDHTSDDIAEVLSASFTGTGATISVSGTPKGSVAAPTFTGEAATSTAPNTTNKSTSVASTSHTHTVTATGDISSTFSGTEGTTSSPSATASVSNKDHTHTVTITGGSVTAPVFTGSEVTTGATANTTTVYSITGVGSVPSLSASIANNCMTFTWSAGSLPSRSSVTVPTSGHTHTVTAAGTNSAPTFTYTSASAAKSTSTTTVAGSGHTHTLTPAGSVTSTLTGTPATTSGPTGSTSVASTSHTHNVTAKGSNSAPTFTGSSTTFTGSYTPAGSVAISGVADEVVGHGTSSKTLSTTYTPAGTVGSKTIAAQTITSTGKFTPTGTVSQPTFSGTKKILHAGFTGTNGSFSGTYTPEGTVTIPELAVSGTVSSSFTGTKRYFTATFTGSSTEFSGTYTPAGSVTAKGTVTSTCDENA